MRRNGAIAVAVVSLAAAAFLRAQGSAAIPEKLRLPDTQKVALEVQATGVQIYTCAATKADAARFEWAFKAPEADLFNLMGKKVGTHYAGPTWESTDGSKVVGEVKAKDDGPAPSAVPWLLLSAKSTSGTGVFTATQSIQRLWTSGGKAPADGCDAAHAGAEARIPYNATYTFSIAKP